jgi:hypothetical protein
MIEKVEPEDVVKFQEHPELVAEVKNKVADVIGGRISSQIVQSVDALKVLKKSLGPELTAIVCSLEEANLAKFTRAKQPLAPTALQARNIAAAYVILDILVSHLSLDQARNWLVEWDDYLYGFPAVEMSHRPEDVRMAALWLISSGGDAE